MTSLFAFLLCICLFIVFFALFVIHMAAEMRKMRQEILDVKRYIRLQKDLYVYKDLFKEHPEVHAVIVNLCMLDTDDPRYLTPQMLKSTVEALQRVNDREKEVCT